ncbi:hypothetical protein [Leminorella grimontii]|uniref:hypothetical protein n=1 Tax=Leminorella grimontii TaxID=82981 RepID=UPI00208B612A|nr:hypothetical protein [Leminorella grimontii]GKX60067.1 hypothetical protein SOASR031_23820 [Leminorella grimontii]
MFINKSLSGFHFFLNEQDAQELMLAFTTLLDTQKTAEIALECAGSAPYRTLLLSCSGHPEDDDIFMSRLSMELRLSYESIELAVHKLSLFLVAGSFSTPEFIACTYKKKTIYLYFMDKCSML